MLPIELMKVRRVKDKFSAKDMVKINQVVVIQMKKKEKRASAYQHNLVTIVYWRKD